MVKMENTRQQQEEALKVMFDYNKKLIPALEEVVVELRGAQKEDTKEYLNYILKGVNWVIQVVNGTKDLLNQQEEVINKEQMNSIIIDLNDYIKEENNIKLAEVIESGVLPFMHTVTNSAKNIVEIEEN
jgi:hypothetical protein